MHELTDEEILDIACGEDRGLLRHAHGGVYFGFTEDSELSADIIDIARKLIAADRAKRSEASEAEIALLKDLADGYIGSAACPLCCNMEWPFDPEDAFKAALPDLLKRKSNVQPD